MIILAVRLSFADRDNLLETLRRIRSTSSARPIVESVALPIVSETYRAFRALRRLSHLRGAERLPELDEVLTESFYATTRLIRTASPLTESSSSVIEIRQKLMRIESLAVSSNFLSDKEREPSQVLRSRIAELADQLQEHNPKADALTRLTSASTATVILCPDARLMSELAATFLGKANTVVVSVSNDTDLSEGAIVPGWFRQSRMAPLLSPPIANPLTLILYDVERRWHQQFSEKSPLRGQVAINDNQTAGLRIATTELALFGPTSCSSVKIGRATISKSVSIFPNRKAALPSLGIWLMAA